MKHFAVVEKMSDKKLPWQMSPLDINVVCGYSCKVMWEDGDEYAIEFHDDDGRIVEAKISKKEFRDWPVSIDDDPYFGLVFYRENKEGAVDQIRAWPVTKYWNPELREAAFKGEEKQSGGLDCVDALVDTYFDRIEIEDTDFYPSDGVDLAFVSLNIPKEMLQEYLRLKGQDRDLPDVAEFWKDTDMLRRLWESDKYHGQGHEPLEHVLRYLDGAVWGEYSEREEGIVTLDVFEEPDP